MPDFELLSIETENTTSHIQKIPESHGHGSFCWIMEAGKSKTPRTFFSAESMLNEIYVFIKNRNEHILKISTLLVNYKK